MKKFLTFLALATFLLVIAGLLAYLTGDDTGTVMALMISGFLLYDYVERKF